MPDFPCLQYRPLGQRSALARGCTAHSAAPGKTYRTGRLCLVWGDDGEGVEVKETGCEWPRVRGRGRPKRDQHPLLEVHTPYTPYVVHPHAQIGTYEPSATVSRPEPLDSSQNAGPPTVQCTGHYGPIPLVLEQCRCGIQQLSQDCRDCRPARSAIFQAYFICAGTGGWRENDNYFTSIMVFVL